MSMQDNEFDDLFRAKLDELEMEPSAQVWDNIDAEVNGRKRKVAILPWLSIAASIIVLITAGILFIPKKEVIKQGRPDKRQLAHTQVKPVAVKPTNNTTFAEQVTRDEQIAVIQVSHTAINNGHAVKRQEVIIDPKQQGDAPAIVRAGPVKTDDQQVLAAASTKPDIIKPVVPGVETPLVVKQTGADATSGFQQQPVLAAVQLPTAIDRPVKQVVKRHGIHNMGDLINLVVAKVDKRKDKAIQFSDGEDESTITGLHIGAIDIKKETK